jgi:pimeloyl-ACP methyl ester carboxylesterase
VRRLVFCHFPYFDEASRARLASAAPTWYHPDGSPPKIPMGAIQPRVSPERFEILRMRMAFDMYRSGPRSAEGYHALARYDALADLHHLRLPVAFIWGEGDQFFPHHQTVLAACPDAAWYVLPAASYTPGYETPRALAAAILDALGAVPLASRAAR